MDTIQNDMNETLITLTSDIVAAHVSNNSVALDDLSKLITQVYGALEGLGRPVEVVEELVVSLARVADASPGLRPDRRCDPANSLARMAWYRRSIYWTAATIRNGRTSPAGRRIARRLSNARPMAKKVSRVSRP